MSNDYFVYGNTLLPGEKARAEDVAAEFQSVVSGFELLPQPRPTGDGFLVPIKVPTATDPAHAAPLAQFEGVQTAAEAARDAAVTARDAAQTAETGAEDDRILTTQYRGETLTFRNEAEGFKDDAQIAASAAQSSAGLPALTGNALKALIVNASATGVEYGTPDVTALHYTKTASDSRYYTQAQIDTNHYTKTQIDTNHYTKTASDSRYYTQAQVDAVTGDKFSQQFNQIGSIAGGYRNGSYVLGDTYAGSTIDANGTEMGGTNILSGTWRCVGYQGGASQGLFVRIA